MHDLKPLKLTAECEMKPGDQITFMIPWAAYLRSYRLSGHRYASGDFVYSSRNTGFEYECTVAGITADREPVMPKTAGETQTDGSVTWTARAPNNSGLDPIQTSVWSSDDITITNDSKNDTAQTTQARLAASSSLALDDYLVKNTVTTVSGDVYIYELVVKVRSNVSS